MKNCLITQLKEIVNNENLEYFEYHYMKIYVSVPNGTSLNKRQFYINLSRNSEATIIGGGSFVDENDSPLTTNTISLLSNTKNRICYSSGEYTIIIKRKECITQMGVYEISDRNQYIIVNAEDFENSQLTDLYYINITGKMKFNIMPERFVPFPIALMEDPSTYITGSWNFLNVYAVSNIRFIIYNLQGQITDFANCNSGTIGSSNGTIYNLESFVENRSRRHVTGTITFDGNDCLKLNNKLITFPTDTFVVICDFNSNGFATITRDSGGQTELATYNGTTWNYNI